MPFLNEIAARLVSQGVGILDQTLFISSNTAIPDGKGPYITITEVGGTGSMRTQNNTAVERPVAQLAARAKAYPVARAMLKRAYDALGGPNGLHNISLSGVQYLSINARTGPRDVGLDGAGRPLVTFDVDVEKQPS